MKAVLTDSPKRKLPREAGKLPICFASPAEVDWACAIRAIHARAEAVTPLLEEILHTRPPIRGQLNK